MRKSWFIFFIQGLRIFTNKLTREKNTNNNWITIKLLRVQFKMLGMLSLERREQRYKRKVDKCSKLYFYHLKLKTVNSFLKLLLCIFMCILVHLLSMLSFFNIEIQQCSQALYKIRVLSQVPEAIVRLRKTKLNNVKLIKLRKIYLNWIKLNRA